MRVCFSGLDSTMEMKVEVVDGLREKGDQLG